MNRVGWTALAAAAGLGAAGAAQAQSLDAQTGANAPANGEVVVTAKRLEQEIPVQLAKQGVRVDIVTGATIKNNGYVDVAQSLQTTVPGLYLAPKNGPFDYVQASLQGSRTEDILWLVDGVRLNNRLYGGTTPLDTLPAAMVDHIEVVEGPQALFYGTQSIAGAVNVVTKDFSDTLNGAISVGGDTLPSYHADAFVRDSFGNAHFVLYGSTDASRGFLPFPLQDFQPSATQRDRAYNEWTVGGKFAYDFTPALRLTVSEQHTEGRLDYAVPELVETAYNNRDEDILTAKLDYNPDEKLELYLKGYDHVWASHYTEFDNDLTTPGTLDDIEDHGPWGYVDIGGTALARIRPIPILDFFLGYDVQAYSGSDAVLVISKHSEVVNALFGEVATTPALAPNVNLAAGFRYNAPSFGPSATVGSVSGRWNLNDYFYIKGQVGTAFRLPTAEELFANDPDDERGDPNLKPETSINANVSIGGRIGMTGLNWEAIGFWRNVNNLIDYASFDATTNQDVFGNVPGTVRVLGGEVILEGSPTPDLTGSVSYTYSSATEDTGLQVPEIPVSVAKAQIDYHPANLPFGLSASVNYVGDIYSNVTGSNTDFGNYVVVNASARFFLDRKRHHRIDINIFNLFDERYATDLTTGVSDTTGNAYVVPDLGEPRTVQVRYTYSF